MWDDVLDADRTEMICEIVNSRPLEEMVARAATSGQRRTKAEMTAFLAAVASIAYDNRPLTVRGLFYRCVAAELIPKDERAYTQVQRAARSLRISGVIAFADLRDGSRSVYDVDAFEDLDSWAQQVHHSYRRDVWANQRVRCECWIEKDAMAGVIADVTQRLGVDLFVTRGFPSLSYTHAAAQTIKRRADRGQSTQVLYLGDRDTSGLQIDDTIREHLEFHTGGREAFNFKRIAVTRQQIAEWELPTRPDRKGDFDAVELDACPTQLLRKLLSDAIGAFIDQDAFATAQAVEESELAIIRWHMGRLPPLEAGR